MSGGALVDGLKEILTDGGHRRRGGKVRPSPSPAAPRSGTPPSSPDPISSLFSSEYTAKSEKTRDATGGRPRREMETGEAAVPPRATSGRRYKSF
ncbi:hypothetical protein ZWY2020_054327 [Hordeum vulgare]|nr:hypothetical protein ZWY2020_054327 [Hordeum vulgare]